MSGRGAGPPAQAGSAALGRAGDVAAGAAAARALAAHWPEYLMEAAGLGLFMVAACLFALLLEHPASPVHRTLDDPLGRRALMGLAMGSTAVALVYSPMGRRSGAHLNPAVTLTFLRLGKIGPWDALFYAAAQFTGGLGGVLLAAAATGPALGDPAVRYVATVPGHRGPAVAFMAEAAISFGLMLAVLVVSNSTRYARRTGLVAGALVATWITVEAPLSGMSMNPARSFGSAVLAAVLAPLWIYFTAPPLGMLLAGELYRRLAPGGRVVCAKLDHGGRGRCIFRCGYARPREVALVPCDQGEAHAANKLVKARLRAQRLEPEPGVGCRAANAHQARPPGRNLPGIAPPAWVGLDLETSACVSACDSPGE